MLPAQRVVQALPWPCVVLPSALKANVMGAQVSCVMAMLSGQMWSEPYPFQAAMDRPPAKKKTLKYFYSVFSPLPSAMDLGCSNDFKRKEQCLSLTRECTHMYTHTCSMDTIMAPR